MTTKIPREGTRARALYDCLKNNTIKAGYATYGSLKNAYDSCYAPKPYPTGESNGPRKYSHQNIYKLLNTFGKKVGMGCWTLKAQDAISGVDSLVDMYIKNHQENKFKVGDIVELRDLSKSLIASTFNPKTGQYFKIGDSAKVTQVTGNDRFITIDGVSGEWYANNWIIVEKYKSENAGRSVLLNLLDECIDTFQNIKSADNDLELDEEFDNVDDLITRINEVIKAEKS